LETLNQLYSFANAQPVHITITSHITVVPPPPIGTKQ